MQKRFYYKFLQKLGIFPDAVFTNSNSTITFPSGGGSFPIFGRSSSVSSATTKFYSLDSAGGDSNAGSTLIDPSDFSNGEVEKAFLAPAGTFDLFNVICNNPAGEGEFFKITIYKNGVATAVTVTINYPDTTASDLAHTITTEEGDLISIKIEGPETSGSFQGSWHIWFTPATA